MTIVEIFGFIASALIGLVLGIMGGGGAILTVPILVYLFARPAETATGYSLCIVGTSALIGSFAYIRKHLIDFRAALLFGVTSIIAVFLTRNQLLPLIPKSLFSVGSLAVTRGNAMLFFFSAIMIFSAISMIRRKKVTPEDASGEIQPVRLAILGLLVGVVAGLVGAGGGFMIVPALVLFAGLEMKKAIGTSLLLIGANSLFGFVGEMQRNPDIEWGFLAAVTGLAVLGIFAGTYLSKFFSGEKLKPAFGYFVMVMGVLIVIFELTKSKS